MNPNQAPGPYSASDTLRGAVNSLRIDVLGFR